MKREVFFAGHAVFGGVWTEERANCPRGHSPSGKALTARRRRK
jgi:hypothetical protein